jgi:hypothetical protein
MSYVFVVFFLNFAKILVLLFGKETYNCIVKFHPWKEDTYYFTVFI